MGVVVSGRVADSAFERYTNEDVAVTAENGDIWIVDVDGTDATKVRTVRPSIRGLVGIRKAGMTRRGGPSGRHISPNGDCPSDRSTDRSMDRSAER
jgi:hypothetical protein